MAAISLMVPDVSLAVLDVPEMTAEKYLLLSAIDFCRRSYAWRSTEVEVETLTSGEFPFDVSAPSGGRVFNVLSVMVGGVSLENTSLRELDTTVSNWRTTTGTPKMFVEEPRGSLTVVPLPSASTDFIITSAFEPTATATTLPDDLYRDYRDAIISGAIMRIAMLPSWFNANLAMAHRALFEGGISRALVSFHGNHTLRGMNVAISYL